MSKKNFIPIFIGFCVIALQRYREILKKYRKGQKLEKKHFPNLKKMSRIIHMRNVKPKIQTEQSDRLYNLITTF